jgi:putative hemin transport protein
VRQPENVRERWLGLRATERGLHALDLAERIGVSECEMLASACGATDEVAATRLDVDWPTLLRKLPQLGHVKTVTRNAHAVIEVEGTYGQVEFFGPMGQSVSSVDLRIFVQRWAHGFAVRDEARRGTSRGLQFFDERGVAIHKVFLRDASDRAFFEALVAEHASPDQAPFQEVRAAAAPPPVKPDASVDVEALRAAWLAMTDTHELFGLLRRLGVARTQALRLVGDDLATPVPPACLEALLYRLASARVAFMVFVGNRGVIQIHTGTVRRVTSTEKWLNVLDPGFDLHVRTDRLATAWVVRKPTSDGIVTALELYDVAGEPIVLLVGKRKPGQPEDAAWRAMVEALAKEARGTDSVPNLGV